MVSKRGGLWLVPESVELDVGFVRHSCKILDTAGDPRAFFDYVVWLGEKYPDPSPMLIKSETQWVECSINFEPGARLEMDVYFYDGRWDRWVSTATWADDLAEALGFE